MSPRPRQTTDAALLGAAARAIGRLGPVRLTLADVAREGGVSPATLVQRFGSKRGLLLALAAAGPEGNRQQFAAIRQAHPSPTEALFALGDCWAQFMGTPEEISNGLAFLQIDLTDPDFRRHAIANAELVEGETRRLIADALAAGELVSCEPAPLARVLGAALHGSLVSWAIHRKGALGDWLRRDLEAVLQPYRPRRTQRTRRRQRTRRTQRTRRRA
ncbi:MAG TPA: TetR/AcrR family transcriptional regulator [Vicinamibacterales bacterium]